MDHRPTLIEAERWPPAERTVVSSLEGIAEAVAGVDCDAAVIMNHRYERDLEYLAAWVGTAVPYIGMLGPRQRTEQMLAALESRGVGVDEATRQRIRAPVGLDIGAETPEEVAWPSWGKFGPCMQSEKADSSAPTGGQFTARCRRPS